VAQVVAAAIIEDGRLLAARRVGGRFGGLWEFPGGKVEPGESDTAALLRELAEELGVTGRVGEPVGGPWPADGGTMRVYLVELEPGATPQCAGSHDALRWLCASETGSVAWIPADLPIVAALLQHLRP
jgi:8-oxo-dGTP diphosphatase